MTTRQPNWSVLPSASHSSVLWRYGCERDRIPARSAGSGQQALQDYLVYQTQPVEILDQHVLINLMDAGIDGTQLHHLCPSGGDEASV